MGFFDEVDSIVINNKEVQSIISSDGGVIYEKSNGYELTLTSDKSIIQTGESATLSATLTNNNVPMAGETIFFYDSNNPPITRSSAQTHTLNVELGSSFKLIYQSSSTYGEGIRLSNEDDSLLIEYSGYDNNIYISINGGVPVTAFSCEGFLKLENGVLSDDGGHTYNLSSYNLNFKLKEMQTVGNNCSVYINPIGSAVTDANGVASVSYTGKGAGVLNIQAFYNERILPSITYEIIDAIFRDHGVTGDKNSNWGIPSRLIVSTNANCTTLTSTSDYQYYKTNDYCSDDFELTINIKSNNNARIGFNGGGSSGQWELYVVDTRNEWNTIKIVRKDGVLTAKKSTDGTNWTVLEKLNMTPITNNEFHIAVTNTLSSWEVSYKDLLVFKI